MRAVTKPVAELDPSIDPYKVVIGSPINRIDPYGDFIFMSAPVGGVSATVEAAMAAGPLVRRIPFTFRRDYGSWSDYNGHLDPG